MLPIPIFVLASGALFAGIPAARRPEDPPLISALSAKESTAQECDDNRHPSLLPSLHKLGGEIHAGVQARKEQLFSDQRRHQMQEFRSSTTSLDDSSMTSLNDPAHQTACARCNTSFDANTPRLWCD
jgi:hypothetical protein